MTIYDASLITYDTADYDYEGLFIGIVASWAVVVLSSVMRKTTSEVSTMHRTLTLSSPLNG